MKIHFSIVLFFISLLCSAQNDSVAYSRDYEFKEGIYLTADQFQKNNPIPKSVIVSSYPKTESDFLTQMFSQKYIVFKDSLGKEQKIDAATVFGYCQNRSVYINFDKEFNRLNVIGRLCHFTATVTTNNGYRDPMDANYAINTSANELRQFIFDTRTNKVLDFNVKNMEVLLKDDSELYNQFMVLKKREKSDVIFIYLRKYNERHPLYLPAK